MILIEPSMVFAAHNCNKVEYGNFGNLPIKISLLSFLVHLVFIKGGRNYKMAGSTFLNTTWFRYTEVPSSLRWACSPTNPCINPSERTHN